MSGLRTLILASSMGCCIAVASAQEPAGLPDLVKNLDAPDAQVRIEATEALFQSPAISLKQMEARLREGQLSPEQRQRLLGVAARRFRSEPRAAMGIQYDGNLGSHRVTLAFLQPGFNAAQVLRVGDRVIAAAGETIDNGDTMRAVIVSRAPADEIPVTVVREGATLNLSVTLGDFGHLRQPSPLDPMVLAEAWRMRSRGLDPPELAGVPPIESGLSPNDWASRYTLLPDEAADMGLVRPGNEAAIGLVAGGEARGGLEGPVQAPAAQRNFNLRGLPEQRRFNPGPQPLVIPQDAAALAQQQELLALRSLLQDRRAQLDFINRKLSDPTVPAADRRLMRSQAEGLSAQIQVLNEKIRRLDEQINPRRFR